MSETTTTCSKFNTGPLYVTAGIERKLSTRVILHALARHVTGDWGDLDEEDCRANDESVRVGSRILSAYVDPHQTRFWIITEADRSSTTILLPEEY